MSVESARLGDVASFIRGITFKPEDVVPLGTDGSIWCLRTKNVQSELDLSDVWAIDADFVKRAEQHLQEGDVLVSSANSWNLVGKCSWVPELDSETTFGGFVTALRGDLDFVDRRYLYHWFSSPRTQTVVRSFSRQTTNIANLDLRRCSELAIPLPSLAEQKRIAAVLDRVDTLRVKRREAITLLDDLAQSIFLDMFGDPASRSTQWDRKTIGELGAVVTGNTPPRAKSENYGNGIEWIKTDNIRPPELNPSQAAEYLTTVGEKVSRVVPAEAILVTCIAGSPASIGNAALAGRRVAINQQINAFIPEGALPRFMLEQIRVGKVLIQRKSTGAMTGLVNKSQFSSISLLVPPVARQQEFVRRVERVDSARARNVRHLATLDELFNSLQHRAFSGTLWDHEAPGEAA
ncbi:restriction endonuclease subunit S [Streptomyces sp. NPDC050287]|uniref:restriction endonuclease subunit S n=1 Tax=Streptomyces sp. NPDC050287 TaxID=3365608 RepID=UPI0037BA37E6